MFGGGRTVVRVDVRYKDTRRMTSIVTLMTDVYSRHSSSISPVPRSVAAATLHMDMCDYSHSSHKHILLDSER
jgi:hypothetical protein